MPRPLRIEYPGALYHVMNRGINRMRVYTDDSHREIFLALLKEISFLFEIKIHSYCLMDNHYHLLIETPHANLSKAMRHLNSLYTQRFNRLEKRDGALFRGRYKAILIESEDYLCRVSRYIHLNPVVAKIVDDPIHYRWSSYRNFIIPSPASWVFTSSILNFFGCPEDYKTFVFEGIDEEINKFYSTQQISSILGSKRFIEEKLNSLDLEYKIATLTDVNRTKRQLNVELIIQSIAKYFAIETSSIKISTKKRNIPRMLAIYLLRDFTLLNHYDISKYFSGIKKTSISAALIKCKRVIKSDPDLNKHYLNLVTILQSKCENGT